MFTDRVEAAALDKQDAEYIDQWRGTVWVEYVAFEPHAEAALAEWGRYGGRIGNFLLFGDDRLLRRIQEACR